MTSSSGPVDVAQAVEARDRVLGAAVVHDDDGHPSGNAVLLTTGASPCGVVSLLRTRPSRVRDAEQPAPLGLGLQVLVLAGADPARRRSSSKMWASRSATSRIAEPRPGRAPRRARGRAPRRGRPPLSRCARTAPAIAFERGLPGTPASPGPAARRRPCSTSAAARSRDATITWRYDGSRQSSGETDLVVVGVQLAEVRQAGGEQLVVHEHADEPAREVAARQRRRVANAVGAERLDGRARARAGRCRRARRASGSRPGSGPG